MNTALKKLLKGLGILYLGAVLLLLIPLLILSLKWIAVFVLNNLFTILMLSAITYLLFKSKNEKGAGDNDQSE